MLFNSFHKTALIALALALVMVLVPRPSALAADFNTTTAVTLIRMASDGKTENINKLLTYQEMRDTLPQLGDGTTRFYLQGPNFVDDPDPDNQTLLSWNPEENVESTVKDYGAVKGTDLKDLCNLIGGMSEGQEVKLVAVDGWNDTFAFRNVYHPSVREGPMFLTWYKDGRYPDNGYDLGLRLLWYADDSVNPWHYHMFGSWDWHEAADSEYWYYYNGQYPDTSGLSGYYISQLIIYSSDPPNPWWNLNGDQQCDMGDMVAIGLKWGQTGAPGWLKEDVNQDGVINIQDVVKIGKYWGESY